MNLDDPRLRLSQFNASNPSLRGAAAPSFNIMASAPGKPSVPLVSYPSAPKPGPSQAPQPQQPQYNPYGDNAQLESPKPTAPTVTGIPSLHPNQPDALANIAGIGNGMFNFFVKPTVDAANDFVTKAIVDPLGGIGIGPKADLNNANQKLSDAIDNENSQIQDAVRRGHLTPAAASQRLQENSKVLQGISDQASQDIHNTDPVSVAGTGLENVLNALTFGKYGQLTRTGKQFLQTVGEGGIRSLLSPAAYSAAKFSTLGAGTGAAQTLADKGSDTTNLDLAQNTLGGALTGAVAGGVAPFLSAGGAKIVDKLAPGIGKSLYKPALNNLTKRLNDNVGGEYGGADAVDKLIKDGAGTGGQKVLEGKLQKALPEAGQSDIKSLANYISHADDPAAIKEVLSAYEPAVSAVKPLTTDTTPIAAKTDVLRPTAKDNLAEQSTIRGDTGSISPGEATAAASPVPTSPAREQLISGLKQAAQQSNEDASNLSAARAVRASKMINNTVGLEGEAATQARLSTLKGAYDHRGEYSGIGGANPENVFEQLRLEAQRDPVMNKSPYELTNLENALKKAVLGVGVDGQRGAPTAAEINRLRSYYGDDVAGAINEAVSAAQTHSQKVASVLGDVAGLPKSIMASYDFSASLRQGGALATRFPKEWAAAAKEQFKYFGSENGFKQGMAEIAARPSYQQMLDSKLAVTGTEALDKTEEQFVSNLAEKIPGVGRGIAASDRAYTGFLTKFRADVFDQIKNQEKQSLGRDLSPEELDGVAKYINTFTGRGDLGKYLERHSQTLSTALFSPRLWKSRLDMLNPVYYAKLSPVARKYALQNAASFAGTASTILGLAALAPGVTVELDPRSADFAKIKIGNQRYDILGGLQQNIVFAYREITGQTKNSQTGEIKDLSGGFGQGSRLSTLTDMVQNKENPLIAAGSQLLQGKDRGGNPVDPIQVVANLLVPLPLSGTIQTANDIGSAWNPADLAKGALMNAPDLVGVSAQNYGSIPTKFKGNPDAQGRPTYNGPIQPNMVTDYSGKAIVGANGQPVTIKLPAGASPKTIKALMDTARAGAVKSQYISGLPQETQALVKAKDEQLKGYVKSGQITQAQYDHIKNIQKTADSVSKGNKYTIPDGAKSTAAQQFYSHWNSMDAKDQKAWLTQAPDTNSKVIAEGINQHLPKGLPAINPSNKVGKMYADYEKDLNTHPNYNAIDKRNKAKAFYASAYKTNFDPTSNAVYQEGPTQDLRDLLANGSVNKDSLDSAIRLDNNLYASGLTTSLKFNKKFRNAFGYSTPSSGAAGGSSGGSAGKSAHLAALLPSFTKASSSAPTFSAASRANPISPVKFRSPTGATPSNGSSVVTAGGFRTARLNALRKSVGS